MKPGDVVKLKSGGPWMTVMHQTSNGNWACCWFNSEHDVYTHQTAIFAEAMLEIVHA